MVPASMLVGVCAAPLWTAQSSYLTIIGKEYAKVNSQEPRDAIPFLFGIFLMITYSASVFSSLISSLVLQQAPPDNYTRPSDDDLALCGINDCPSNNVTNINLQKPSDHLVWILVGIYIFSAVVGFVVSIMFVDELPVHLGEDTKSVVIKESLKQTYNFNFDIYAMETRSRRNCFVLCYLGICWYWHWDTGNSNQRIVWLHLYRKL